MPANILENEHWPHKHLPFVLVDKCPEFKTTPLENVDWLTRETEYVIERWTRNPNGGWDIQRQLKAEFINASR